MTQVNNAQHAGRKVASHPHARRRTLAQRRADVEEQIRACVANDLTMALTEPEQVKSRMKALRDRTGMKQHEVAHELGEPPRTFQSWENAEVETDRDKYDKIAAFYSAKLGTTVTANWILFGQDVEPPLPSATPDLVRALDQPDPAADLRAQLDRMERLLTALASRLGVDVRDLEVESLVELVPGEEATPEPVRESPRPAGAKTS